MPDKKLTDNEVVKALECCLANTNDSCFVCHFNGSNQSCIDVLIQYSLDLINRQKAENKRLSTLAELGNTRANDYRVMRDRALKAEAENERLTIRLRKVEHQLDDLCKMHHIIKAEAYKEFAERFKKKLSQKYATSLWKVYCEEIDNLLKELVGGSE